ncbi:MAG TPA: CARDB domain-containing protein [Candidatus Limnocylindrales bacterium]|nr:CARDB domain-containing protein [Candidatus Limnocylindrales bacterium]
MTRLRQSFWVVAAGMITVACVSVAPGASAPATSSGLSPAPSKSAEVVPSAGPTTAATDGPPTEGPQTPRPTRRPRPSADASPTDPPDIDVAVYSYTITPHADDPAAGYHVDLDITIENTGTDRARRFTVAATCLGYTQEQDVFGGIDAGGQYVISFGYYLSIPGDKQNKIVLDSTDRLAETDEDNNTYELLSAPDEYPDSCDREAGAPTVP